MTNTSFAEFKKLLARLPKERYKELWLLPLRSRGDKRPQVPKGTPWKGNLAVKLTVTDAIKRLKRGDNVGVVGLPGGLMFLDLDVENGKMKAPQSFIDEIPATFTIETRNGGRHYYFWNNGEYGNKNILLCDMEESIKAGELIYSKVGELRTDWQYVVSPGSYYPPDGNNCGGDGTYRVIRDVPIVKFEGAITRYFEKRNEPPPKVELITKTADEKANAVSLKQYKQKLRDMRVVMRIPLRRK